MRRLRVLLDANVLVDAQVRDFFFTLAEAELIDVRWSAEIVEETRRALLERIQVSPERVDRLIAAIARAFPGAEVEDYGHLTDEIELPDGDDRHVLAAAVHGECDLLVTFNEKDFPDEAVAERDVQVLTADEAVFMLAGVFPDRIAAVVEVQVGRLKKPSMTTLQFLDRLATRAPTGTAALGAALRIEPYERIFEDIILSESSTSAQSAVRRLIWAVEDGDVASTVALVDADLAQDLTGKKEPLDGEVQGVLRERLDDVFAQEGWGIATARRPHGPDVELVKLVRAGDDPSIAFDPQDVQGHLFYMRLSEDGWVLVELDGPDPAVESA
jgi:predicted nucleic acid-binding protein